MDGPTRVGAGGQRDRTARGRKVEISAALSGRQSTGEVPEKASPVRVLDSASADARKPRCLFCSQRSLKIGAHDPLHTANARVEHEVAKLCLLLQFPTSAQGFSSDIQTNPT